MKYYINTSFLSLKAITGISRFALSMCYGLKNYFGDNVVFICPQKIAHPKIAEELSVVRIGSKKNPFIEDLNKYRLIWEQTELPLYLWRQGKPLLINFTNTAPLYYKNQIVSVLDIFYEHHKEILPNSYSFYSKKEVGFYKFVIPRIARIAKRVITISEYSKKDISKEFSIAEDLISVIYPAIPSIFLNDDSKHLSANKYGKYILGVSSVMPHKNFDGLIGAFKRANLPDVKLVIVGNVQKSTENYSLYNSYKDDSRIEFTGFVSDEELINIYKNAIFFVYPSFFEGFGIPPLEAMAFGCPTLVSNVASLPEVCGKGSLYVDPYDIESMTNGIIKLFYDIDLQTALRKEGFKRVNFFKEKDPAKELISILNQFTLRH